MNALFDKGEVSSAVKEDNIKEFLFIMYVFRLNYYSILIFLYYITEM